MRIITINAHYNTKGYRVSDHYYPNVLTFALRKGRSIDIGRISLKKCLNRFSLFEPCNLGMIEDEGTNNLFTPYLCTLICRIREERRIYYDISTVLVIFGKAIKVQSSLIT